MSPPHPPPQDIMSVPWWRSFVLRFVGIYTAVFIVVLLVGIHWLHRFNQHEVVDRFGLALESIAATAALSLSGEALLSIQSNDDAASPAFEQLRGQLARVAEENHLAEDQIYILRPETQSEGAYSFVVMLQEETFVGDRYRPPPEVRPLYAWVVEHRDAVRTPLFTDAHGTFVSGLAPVLTQDGEAVALLQVDYGIDRYMKEVQRLRDRLLLGLGAVGVFMLLVGAWIYNYMRCKVEAVLSGTQAIAREEYGYQIQVPGHDELATIAAALNRVLDRLKERFEMLKFLPRHTTQMIQAASGQGVRLDMGRRVRVAILESDIRGFTSISEQLSPEEVVGMLNTYIRAQAEHIEALGGSIDKYMGDAVLAVFEGPNCESASVKAALAIQGAVRGLNARGAFSQPVTVGVGLAVGEVVMGNMGSEQRMEHTVIGATVNLAARLCSAAEAGEVVVEAEMLDGNPGPEGVVIGAPEFIAAKGFAEPVTCYRLRLMPR